MKVIMTGGGTGGHIYPAIAIAERLKSDYSSIEILYIGAELGFEKELVPAKGIPFQTVSVAPLNRKKSLKTIGAMFQTLKGVVQSMAIIRRFKPDVIIGTGGYVAGPVVLAGALLGVPCAIHEQNAFPGMTNKLLSRFVDTVMLTFEEAETHFPVKDKTVYTGLPVREAFFNVDREAARRKLGILEDVMMILTVGGSNGAQKLNEVMMKTYAHFAAQPSVHFFHVTGKRYYDGLQKAIEDGTYHVGDNFTLLNFIDDMPLYLAASDLVISRAGASTITEIIATQTPSIIIPSPNVANDHQFHNAKVLDKNGMGLVIREQALNEDLIEHTLKDFMDHPDKLEIMRLNCARLDIRSALDKIETEVMRIRHKDKG